MNVLVASLTSLYSKLLLLYPRSFRDEFADEMQVVFSDSVNEASKGGIFSLIIVCLREAVGLPFNILREFWHEFQRKETVMVTNEKKDPASTRSGKASHWEAFLSALPFALFGVVCMIGKIRVPWIGIYVSLTFYFFVLLGLLIGLVKAFPRWAYSYLGWSLVFAWWWTNMHTTGLRIFGYTMGDEGWGWRIWYPLLITIGIALLWTRSIRVFRQLISGIWQDWTLLSLAMYTFVGWMMLIYDENHSPYLYIFMTASTLVVSGGAWAFLRSTTVRNRVIVLLSSFLISAIISWICDATWDWNAYYGIPPAPPQPFFTRMMGIIAMIAIWLAIMFWPALIGLVRHIINDQQKPGMEA